MKPSSTLPTGEKPSEDPYNAAEQLNKEKMAAGFHDSLPGYNRANDGLDDHPISAGDASADDPQDSSDAVRRGEEAPQPTPEWQDNTGANSGEKTKTPFSAKFRGFMKKRGALVTILSVLGIGGGVLAGFAGPTSMLVAAMENITSQNDSTSTVMERRFMKVLGYATTGDPICAKSSVSIKCKMGRISNKALTKLEAKGVRPVFADDATNTTGSKGYPSENPTHYDIDNDGKTDRVAADKLTEYFSDNTKIAGKVLGTAGAFNMRVQAWTGKYIKEKFFDKFNIEKKGGIADGDTSSKTSKERLSEVLDKLKLKIPGLEKLQGVSDSIKAKATKQIGGAKKAGVGYTIAVAGCITVKMPGYIAGATAAVQLAQELPYVSETILSPADKLKAAGVDKSVNFTADDADATGSLLTTEAKSSDGTVGAPISSPLLLSAMGINTGKPAVSESLTPGYSAFTNKIVVDANAASKASAPACNTIMSPAAMYTALAVDSAVTVAASTTIVGGLIKVGASLVISELVTKVATDIAGKYASAVVTDLAQNDNIPKAVGKDLGDVIGLSALSYFSAGGMAHGLRGLKVGQLTRAAAIQQESQDAQRARDVASMSPFDASSQYTFLGSIIHNFGTASITTGASGGVFSTIMGYLQTPFASLTASANADNFNTANCTYASSFELSTSDTGSSSNDPAINAAGLPCTGMDDSELNMSTDTALTLIQNEGWIDDSKNFPDGATIDDLVASGYIVGGTPLTDYIDSCTNADTGDYIFNAAGCTLDATTKDPSAATAELSSNSSCTGDSCTNTTDFNDTSGGVSDPQALTAIAVFLNDFQEIQSINGEDDETGSNTTTTASTADATIDQAHIYDDSTSVACAVGTTDAGTEQGYYNGNEINIRLCSIPNTVDNGPSSTGEVRVNSRVSGAFLELVKGLTASSANNGSTTLRVADSFRTMKGQQDIYAQYGSPRAAAPGYSNHQMGLAIDFQLGSNTGATRPGDPVYDYLVANANKYGITKLNSEAWHWQPLNGQGSATSL